MQEIKQISAVFNHAEGHSIWGLGEDNKVYAWNWIEGKWTLHAKPAEPTKK